ncbi:MAG: tRNA (guanosine(18)-2'-O)-methyltransferase TrmH [Anaerolineae bacterium]
MHEEGGGTPAGMITPRRREKIIRTAAARQQGVVVLEDIHDPHNAEAVFRTCDAFGFQHVALIFEQQQPFDPRRIGKATSSSANKWLTFSVYHSTEECLAALKAQGYEIAATVLSARAESLFEADLTRSRLALLLGNEHRGLSQRAIDLADRHLIIPMSGMVQSLNLSVSAAICLYEITRQRHAAGIDAYRLPPDEQARLIEDLIRR